MEGYEPEELSTGLYLDDVQVFHIWFVSNGIELSEAIYDDQIANKKSRWKAKKKLLRIS